MDGRSHGLRGKLACRCVLVETASELVLIDTGFGLGDIAAPRQRLSRFFLQLLDPDFREELTAVRQIEALGYSARDVRHIILTHLDFDHAGGLDDFPDATIHMLHSEMHDAVQQKSWLDRQRFRPMQWSSYDRWTTYEADGTDKWFGFDAVRELRGVPPEILLVPLIGHTMGHAGIAIRDAGKWLMLAGDAYFDHDEMDLENPRCLPGLRLYQWMMDKNHGLRVHNQERLRQLIREQGHQVKVICSHDPREMEIDSGRPLEVPPSPDLVRHDLVAPL